MADDLKINGKASFVCKVRANLVTEEVVKDLKKINVVEIGMGLESGCEETLDYLKGGVTIEDNRRAVDIIKKNNIMLNPTFIIGVPHESKDQIMQTFDFIKISKIDQFNVFTLTPLPGTPVWEYALEKGMVSNDMDWSKLALNPGFSNKNTINLSEHLTNEELNELLAIFEKERNKRYYKNLLKKAVSRPQQIIPFIKRKMRLFLKSRASFIK